MSKLIDITGQRFGRWVAIRRINLNGGESKWECKCDCGTVRVVWQNGLRNGTSKSCGCLNREISRNMKGANSVHWRGGGVTKLCPICGGAFKTSRGPENKTKKYCSDECRRIGRPLKGDKSPSWKGGLVTLQCAYCGKDTRRKPNEIKDNKMFFCSRACQGRWKSENQRQESHYNWNPDLDREGRAALRKSREMDEWRTSVFHGDLFMCQACECTGSGLNAHHIINFEALFTNGRKDIILDTDNGITLCAECHREYHHEYGNKNNNEDQLWEFIANHKIT